jgi:hypothetical protein
MAENPSGTWSNFGELQYALRTLKRMSLFSLFLSTTAKMTKIIPSQEKDPSRRIMQRQFRLVRPFTDFGFDHLAKKITLDGELTLVDITSNKHIAHSGRPMYVLLSPKRRLNIYISESRSKVWCAV